MGRWVQWPARTVAIYFVSSNDTASGSSETCVGAASHPSVFWDRIRHYFIVKVLKCTRRWGAGVGRRLAPLTDATAVADEGSIWRGTTPRRNSVAADDDDAAARSRRRRRRCRSTQPPPTTLHDARSRETRRGGAGSCGDGMLFSSIVTHNTIPV